MVGILDGEIRGGLAHQSCARAVSTAAKSKRQGQTKEELEVSHALIINRF